jgi:hypothetical protein
MTHASPIEGVKLRLPCKWGRCPIGVVPNLAGAARKCTSWLCCATRKVGPGWSQAIINSG